MKADQLEALLREIRDLVADTHARRDDLVDAAYVGRRTGLSARTVAQGKAGTNAIARCYLKAEGTGKKAGLLRFPRYAVDKFVADKAREAVANTTSERVLNFDRKRRRAS